MGIDFTHHPLWIRAITAMTADESNKLIDLAKLCLVKSKTSKHYGSDSIPTWLLKLNLITLTLSRVRFSTG
jgi:hypothetical protein